eukprot:tig00020531_g10053.t1
MSRGGEETPMSTFDDAMARYFPGFMTLSDFIAFTTTELARLGMNSGNTMPCIATCREGHSRAVAEVIMREWGTAGRSAQIVSISCVAGVPYLGKAAFHDIARTVDKAFACYGFAQLSINEWGEIGKPSFSERRSSDEPPSALQEFVRQFKTGRLRLDLDLRNVEASLLRQDLHRRLCRTVSRGAVDLPIVTRAAMISSHDHLEALVQSTAAARKGMYAVLSGVHICGPEDRHYVYPGPMYVQIAGTRTNITSPVMSESPRASPRVLRESPAGDRARVADRHHKRPSDDVAAIRPHSPSRKTS